MPIRDKTKQLLDHAVVREFYDSVYYGNTDKLPRVPRHLQRLAKKLGPWKGQRLLDVACGTGDWLMAAAALDAIPAGIDISQKALEVCRRALPHADIHCGPAEKLPFGDHKFDFITCLGALEHFLDPHAALREMVRVGKPNAVFLLLVPNSEFLTRRLGIFSGTHQTDVKEEVRSLHEWRELFASAGITVLHRWRDLHVLSASWIFRGPWYGWPLRAAQAFALPLWPLSWQYQVYH
ncbi:MAG: class I SAM-dependent methyltransferase, partial [Gammaproteobacteria bacterium]